MQMSDLLIRLAVYVGGALFTVVLELLATFALL